MILKKYKKLKKTPNCPKTQISYSKRTAELYSKDFDDINQNLHWKLGQQAPSVGSILAYLETTA